MKLEGRKVKKNLGGEKEEEEEEERKLGMGTKVKDQTLVVENLLDEQLPLLQIAGKADPKAPKTLGQRAIRKTFKGTAHLANLLPTGTVLAFQILSPIFTHQGECHTVVTQTTTLILVALCGFSCFLMCFTDSFRDEQGKVRYGLATFDGLWVIDGSVSLPREESAKYRLRFIDFFHALMTMMVFGAVVLFDQNVVHCLCPEPSEELKELLVAMPIGIGIVCSLLFVAFPTQRHGIGFPLSRR